MQFKPTIPNFLTIFRVLLILPILYFLLHPTFFNLFLALALYGVSALTDSLDGMLARKLNQESEFGAYFDPLADKFLVWSLFTVFCFIPELMIPLWLIVFIFLRDFAVTYLRSYSKKNNIQFKTSFIAKAKTTVQMIAAFLIMLYLLAGEALRESLNLPHSTYTEVWNTVINSDGLISYMPLLLTILTVLFTIYTGLDYYLTYNKNKVKKNEK
jgi:CDP-diacylglycerol--glycerol-3-phosphate 3-phosphatidyltransferase